MPTYCYYYCILLFKLFTAMYSISDLVKGFNNELPVVIKSYFGSIEMEQTEKQIAITSKIHDIHIPYSRCDKLFKQRSCKVLISVLLCRDGMEMLALFDMYYGFINVICINGYLLGWPSVCFMSLRDVRFMLAIPMRIFRRVTYLADVSYQTIYQAELRICVIYNIAQRCSLNRRLSM